MARKTTSPRTPHPTADKLRALLDRLADESEAAGLPRGSAESLIGIDAAMFAWRRRLIKDELVHAILARLDAGIEKAEFEALTAVARLNAGIGATPRKEVTIGDIAEELTIDPSRASRLVSALVNKQFLKRDIAQSDARKTIIVLTDKANALFNQFMTLKWRVMFDVFGDWSLDDMQAFERLMSGFVGAMDDAIARIEAPDDAPLPTQ